MKKQALTVDRIDLYKQTDNHQSIILLNVKIDLSFNEIFAVSLLDKEGNPPVVMCRKMDEAEKRHSGQHFNTIEPNHKKRLNRREWKKRTNQILGLFKFEI